MGTVSLAHIAMACLLIAGDAQLAARVNQLVQSWPEPDRSDLLWFLKTQGLSID